MRFLSLHMVVLLAASLCLASSPPLACPVDEVELVKLGRVCLRLPECEALTPTLPMGSFSVRGHCVYDRGPHPDWLACTEHHDPFRDIGCTLRIPPTDETMFRFGFLKGRYALSMSRYAECGSVSSDAAVAACYYRIKHCSDHFQPDPD